MEADRAVREGSEAGLGTGWGGCLHSPCVCGVHSTARYGVQRVETLDKAPVNMPHTPQQSAPLTMMCVTMVTLLCPPTHPLTVSVTVRPSLDALKLTTFALVSASDLS